MADPKKPAANSAAEALREALAAKKALGGGGKTKLRPKGDGGKIRPDAERLAGKSRKVH